MTKKTYTQADYDAAEVWWQQSWLTGTICRVHVLRQTDKTVLFICRYSFGGVVARRGGCCAGWFCGCSSRAGGLT